MANKKNGKIYTGVTSNLPKRVYEHKSALTKGFTKTYSCKLLIWYETHSSMENAIIREKQIKAGSRRKKLALIEDKNSNWNDLFSSIT